MSLIFLPHLPYIKPYKSYIFNVWELLSNVEIGKYTDKSKCMETCFHRKEASVLSTVLKKLDQLAICEC